MSAPTSDVTALLKAWRAGDDDALERLTPLVYGQLRRLGQQFVRQERAAVRGDATSLVHDAFVRLVDARAVNWQDRAHFLAFSARIMRRVLVDAARARGAAKRGAGLQRMEAADIATLDELPAPVPDRASEMAALEDALVEMAKHEPRRVQVVELRYFGGLTVEETAAVLGISPQTVLRDWKLARAWLALELRGGTS